MLYDNALLVRVYLEAYQATGSLTWREIATNTIDFVLREMTEEEGGFYSALDADSEGEEGRFYVWSKEEISRILGSRASAFCNYYDVSVGGNFEGTNILHPRADLRKMAERLEVSVTQLEGDLARARRELLKAREARTRPGLDDKVLTAWNGLMLSALSRAGFVLGSPTYLEAAIKNAEFLAGELIVEGRIHRTWKAGRARLNGYLEDYAAAIEGFLSLFEANGEARWIQLAGELMDLTIERFWDEASSSFFFTSHDHEKLIVRQKEFMDNATPSGNSTCCLSLLRLGHLLDRPHYHELAGSQLGRMTHALHRHPLAFGTWLQALDFHLGPVTEIVVLGHEGWDDPFLKLLREKFLPGGVFVLVREAVPSKELRQTVPLLRGKSVSNGSTTVYVCRDSVCTPPLTSISELESHLNSIG